jgi:hypothetical protein
MPDRDNNIAIWNIVKNFMARVCNGLENAYLAGAKKGREDSRIAELRRRGRPGPPTRSAKRKAPAAAEASNPSDQFYLTVKLS